MGYVLSFASPLSSKLFPSAVVEVASLTSGLFDLLLLYSLFCSFSHFSRFLMVESEWGLYNISFPVLNYRWMD